MSRIIITTVGTLGDLHPMIAIALQLRQRGHHIAFATHEKYRHKLTGLAFEFHPIRPDLNPTNDPDVAEQLMDSKTGTQAVVQLLMDNLRDTYTDLTNCTQNTDLIIAGEAAYSARLVAAQKKIPLVAVVLQPAAFLSPYDMPVLPPAPFLAKLRDYLSFNTVIVQLIKRISQPWTQPLRALRKELQLPSAEGNPLFDEKQSASLVLVMFSRVFAQPQPDWPTNSVQAGFPFYSGEPETAQPEAIKPDIAKPTIAKPDIAKPTHPKQNTPQKHNDAQRQRLKESEQTLLDDFLSNGEPPIIFTLGSAAVTTPGKFYSASVQAAEQLKRRAILLIGNNPPPTHLLANLPESILAIGYAPYVTIFPAACAIVHQGGMGATAQALRAGKPTLIVPYSHDQPDNAARAERLGTSVTVLRDRYTAQTAAQGLQRLLTVPTYSQQAQAIGQQMQQESGVKTACNAIENLLGETARKSGLKKVG